MENSLQSRLHQPLQELPVWVCWENKGAEKKKPHQTECT